MAKYKIIPREKGAPIKLKNYLHGKSKRELEEIREKALRHLGKIKLSNGKYRKQLVSDYMNVDNGTKETFTLPEPAAPKPL